MQHGLGHPEEGREGALTPVDFVHILLDLTYHPSLNNEWL